MHHTLVDWTIGTACRILVTVLFLAQAAQGGGPSGPVPRDSAVERKIDSLLAIMTVEEKLGQLNQILASWDDSKKKTALDSAQVALLRQGRVGSFLNVVGAEHTQLIQKIAVEETRLHIPLIFGLDVIHGFRTIFPIPLAQACSWNPELVERTSRIAAVEAAASGITWTFAPMVDIARDPRWGRIAEGSGEDPYLGSALAAARVRGFQTANLRDSGTILACAKHFAAYGGAEAGRDYNTVDLSERTLREVYLEPFRAAVNAGAGSLMSGFNEISGVPSSASRWLLTDVLRGEWGFDGFVVSDWTAVEELLKHRIASTRAEAGIRALSAGVDMDMVSGIFAGELPEMVRTGKLPESAVDEAVRRVLRIKFRLGLFDNPYRNAAPGLAERVILAPEHLSAARQLATESIVLLKNTEKLLPLRSGVRTIALIGPLADDSADVLGPWDAVGREGDVVTVLRGMLAKSGSARRIVTARGCGITGDDTSGFAEAAVAAAAADVALLVVGEDRSMSGEAASRSEIGLPGVQHALVRRIVATGTPVVLILMNGRPLAIPWEAEYVPAIVEAWYPGVQTGTAVADILFGDANPSGKLAVTVPRSVGQIPLYYNFKSTGRPALPDEKYTSKYLDAPNSPLFPFGFGLSYTTYEYSDVRVERRQVAMDDTVRLSIEVRNSGDRAGDEIVQLYVRDDVASVTRPVQELKGFRRVHLEPGASAIVSFVLTAADLAFYDGAMHRVTEPGTFTVFIGPNSVERKESSFELVAN